MIVEFFIPYKIEPKQSMRMSNGISYTPTKIKNNAAALALFCAEHRPASALDGPIEARYVFQYPYLSGDRKRDKQAGRTLKHCTRPDLGNLEKQLEDVLEAAGVIANDSRIWHRDSRKVRCPQPGIQICLANGDDLCHNEPGTSSTGTGDER